MELDPPRRLVFTCGWEPKGEAPVQPARPPAAAGAGHAHDEQRLVVTVEEL
jgi:hypothetical protein